jgi:hypothetical protein
MLEKLWRWLLGAPPPAHAPQSPHPANVPGPFYVQDGCCITCGVWEFEAPDLLAWIPGENHCYVQRQPQTDAEFEQMKRAMEVGEVDCIRVHACKPEWLERLRDEGLGHHIDPETGPMAR